MKSMDRAIGVQGNISYSVADFAIQTESRKGNITQPFMLDVIPISNMTTAYSLQLRWSHRSSPVQPLA